MDICEIGNLLVGDRKIIKALVTAQQTIAEVGCDGLWYELDRLIQEYSKAHTEDYKELFDNMNLALFCELADNFRMED